MQISITVMQVTIHQIAGNAHFLLLFWPPLIAGNMINYTQIAGIPAIAGRLASLQLSGTYIHWILLQS